MTFSIPRLYAIIDPAQTRGRSPVAVCEDLLSAGIRLIQHRDKRATPREFLRASVELAKRVREARGVFIVNDRADVALAVSADGVHLGQDDLPVELARRVLGQDKWIGCSTHRLDQLTEADKFSATYVAFGPVFPTGSKEGSDPVVGLEGLRKAREATRKPLVAIGGMTVENARAAIEAGADAVAVISDLVGAVDVAARAREFLKALEEL
jgi:thiamine-phosphate pyrophosphorylase